MKNKNVYLYLSAVVCILSFLGMIISLNLTGDKSERAEFIPPPFETAAQSGMPDITEESWTEVCQDGVDFSVHICCEVVLDGKTADIFFTNDDGNEVWMKLRIMDENDIILAETGLLKPNEYVRTVSFDTIPAKGTKIKLKILAYEPDTYYSAGTVTVNTTIGG